MRRTRITIASCLCNELWRWAVGCVRDECRHLHPTIRIHSSSIVYLDQMRFNSQLRSSKFRESSTTTTAHSELFALNTRRAFGERSQFTEAKKYILIASSSSLAWNFVLCAGANNKFHFADVSLHAAVVVIVLLTRKIVDFDAKL